MIPESSSRGPSARTPGTLLRWTLRSRRHFYIRSWEMGEGIAWSAFCWERRSPGGSFPQAQQRGPSRGRAGTRNEPDPWRSGSTLNALDTLSLPSPLGRTVVSKCYKEEREAQRVNNIIACKYTAWPGNKCSSAQPKTRAHRYLLSSCKAAEVGFPPLAERECCCPQMQTGGTSERLGPEA